MIYDVLIIGGGPAGYRAAERAGHKKLAVALFEERSLGGTCLNEGCIPTKTLLYSAKLFDYANGISEHYGVKSNKVTIDHAAVIARKDQIVKTLVGGVAMQMKGAKVNVVKYAAKIIGKSENGFIVEANGEKFEGKKLIIASGSTAAVPPIPGLREAVASGDAVTNREVLALTKAPKKLIVLGGGVIGLEMASYFNSIGTEVTVVEMLDRIGGPTDIDMSTMLQDIYTKRGVKFMLKTKATAVKGTSLEIENAKGKQLLKADKILVAIGRRSNTANLNLESIGVSVERGIPTDDEMKTNVPGVFAIGDVNGKSMLAHTAYREAEIAVNVIAGQKDKMNYNAVPSVIYTNPEISSVGESEESAKNKGLKFHTVKLPLAYSGRYLAENDGGQGFLKLILDQDNIVIGACIIGNPGSELIFGLAIAVEKKMSCKQLSTVVFPHPTVGEVFRDAILSQL